MNQSKSIQNNNRSALKGSKQNQKPKVRRNRNKGRQVKDRDVSVPSAKGKVVQNNRPLTQPANNGDIIISHREFIADVTGAFSGFDVDKYSINPGLPGSFPWLSTVARSYESYRFERLEFRYETQAPTTIPGTAILAVDYDASDTTPTTKTQAMAYRGSVRSPTWSDCEHSSLKEDLNKRKTYYVRSGNLSANQDVKLYDVGNLYMCMQAQGADDIYGELYVEYRVHLMTPQVGNIGIGEAIFGIFSGSSNSAPFSSSSGNMPAVVESIGSTTSISTWTFSQPWEGYVTLNITGTGLLGITSGGTAAPLDIFDEINAAATRETAFYLLVAPAGSTFSLEIANTTISACSAYFAQGDA